MRATLLAVAALALAGCGQGALGPPGVDLNLIASRGLIDQLSAFQVTLVTQGSTLDCVAVEKACVRNQVDASRFVPLKDSSGKQAKALSFAINLVQGAPNTQDLSLREVPLGHDLAVVVEAISRDAPARLAGSSCNYVKDIAAGTNATVFARIAVLTPAASCDPRLTP